MTRAAAHRLARYLRRLGYVARVRRHRATSGWFYIVQRAPRGGR
jgi:hypothetical protein